MPKRHSGTFSYPGGKTTIAPWIIEHFPQHDVYVEPFGGSASVLMQKQKSNVEVYNDLNSDCVAFFEAIKDYADELAEWIETTPYSRELYGRWLDQFDSGERPNDTVEQAGRFWFLTSASFGSDFLNGGGTFSVQKNRAKEAQYAPIKWKRKAGQTEYIRRRFQHVQIENLDYLDVFEKYDGENTFFYCDPPYVDVGDEFYQTNDGGFDHTAFVDSLQEMDGYWLVSYGRIIPEGLDQYHNVTREKETTMSLQRPKATETLVMNYDPNTTPKHTEAEQTTLAVNNP